MKKNYKAVVCEIGTTDYEELEFTGYPSKKSLIEELAYNGYRILLGLVEETEVYDWIMEHTNADAANWSTYRTQAKRALGK